VIFDRSSMITAAPCSLSRLSWAISSSCSAFFCKSRIFSPSNAAIWTRSPSMRAGPTVSKVGGGGLQLAPRMSGSCLARVSWRCCLWQSSCACSYSRNCCCGCFLWVEPERRRNKCAIMGFTPHHSPNLFSSANAVQQAVSTSCCCVCQRMVSTRKQGVDCTSKFNLQGWEGRLRTPA
jgi:hypothetical protein